MILVGLARVVRMTNYVPKESPPTYDPLKSSDPRIQKDIKKFRIQKLKYNKYQTNELTSTSEATCTCHLSTPASNSQNNHVKPPSKHLVKDLDQSPDMSPVHLYQSLESDVREIRRFIKTLIYKQKTQENLEKIRGEWRAIALVIDRAFFYLYTVSIVVSLATLFPRGT